MSEQLTAGSGTTVRRTALVLAVLLVCFVIWVAFAGRLLVSVGPARRADAVFALSGDPLGDRLRAAVNVLQSTGTPRLIAFVEGASSLYDSRKAARRYLEARGVRASDIRLVGPGSSTAEEAGVAGGLVRRCGWSSIIVVTSPFHTRRAGWLFAKAVGDQAAVTTVANNESFHAATWWAHDTDTELVLQEWLKSLSSVRYLFDGPPDRETAIPC
jgi:uncharacterized SAM-binding protein YcdF (DUF218 family)